MQFVSPAVLLNVFLVAAYGGKLYGSDMFSVFVYMFISLHPFFNTLSVAVHPSGHEKLPWFMGCVNASDFSFLRLYTPRGAHDLDPVTCSVRCLDEG